MSVLIGLVEQVIENSDKIQWDINKIGGTPIWLNASSNVYKIPECQLCGRPSVLVSQLYCPLGDSSYHRVLYVFVCSGGCHQDRKGWRVFRCLKLDPSYNQPAPQEKTVQNDCWHDDQDDWGQGSGDDWGQSSTCENDLDEWNDEVEDMQGEVACEASSRPQTAEVQSVEDGACAGKALEDSIASMKLQDSTSALEPSDEVGTASAAGSQVEEEEIGLAEPERWDAMARLLNTKHEQSPADVSWPDGDHGEFIPYYLYVVEEPCEETVVSDHVSELIRSYEQSEGKRLDLLISESRTGRGKGCGEGYEKAELKHGDGLFHKFVQRIRRAPQQCIRYDIGGEPLLVTPLVKGDSPDFICPRCGGQRLFELQLLPPLIPWLSKRNGKPSNIEFGTVLVYTCTANCWTRQGNPSPDDLDLIEELVVLQADPDQHLFR